MVVGSAEMHKTDYGGVERGGGIEVIVAVSGSSRSNKINNLRSLIKVVVVVSVIVVAGRVVVMEHYFRF